MCVGMRVLAITLLAALAQAGCYPDCAYLPMMSVRVDGGATSASGTVDLSRHECESFCDNSRDGWPLEHCTIDDVGVSCIYVYAGPCRKTD